MRNIRKKILAVAGAVSLMSAMLPIGTLGYYANGYEVYVNGNSIGTVENELDAMTALAEVNDVLTKTFGEESVINPDIQLREKSITQETLLDEQKLYNSLAALSDKMVPATMITIDGKDSVSVVDNTAAIETTALVINKLGLKNAENGTVQIVSYYDTYVPETAVIGADAAAEYFIGADLLTVYSSVKKTSTEKFAPTPEEYIDDTLYEGVRVTTEKGTNGTVTVTKVTSYVNGELTNSEEHREIINNGIPAKVAIGTKPRPAGSGTGTFMTPTSGRLSSPFGMRWGRMHNGVDLAAPTGTPIYAADDGTVIRSENKGSYGNYIVIDHKNGYTTYYAHNSANLVSVGDTVTKGYQIAKMGSTGRSTGPHLHFEVRYNDVPQDPMNYIG